MSIEGEQVVDFVDVDFVDVDILVMEVCGIYKDSYIFMFKFKFNYCYFTMVVI